MNCRLLSSALTAVKADDSKRQRQGTEPKSCDQVGQFSSSFQSVQEVKDTHILLDVIVENVMG